MPILPLSHHFRREEGEDPGHGALDSVYHDAKDELDPEDIYHPPIFETSSPRGSPPPPSPGPFASALRYYASHPLLQLLPAIILTLTIWFLPPFSPTWTATSMHVLAIFLGIITALVTSHYPPGPLIALALLSLTLSRSFQCMDAQGNSVECARCGSERPLALGGGVYTCDGYDQSMTIALSGFASEANWLIFFAFQIGKAVEISNLGRRVALLILRLLGSSLLGLGYALVLTEVLLAPFVPSSTARGGAIVMPITVSIAKSLHSSPTHAPRAGTFLTLTAAHANLISSAMFLTGSSANTLIQSKALSILGINLSWGRWFIGASIPCIIVSLALPPLLWILSGGGRHHVKVKEARGRVKEGLRDMGRLSLKEALLLVILLACIGLWATIPLTHLKASSIALIAMVLLLVSPVLPWEEVLGNRPAWDALFWLGGFYMLAEQLTAVGVTSSLGHGLSSLLASFSPLASTVCLGLLYFLTDFIFASLLAHTVALASFFLSAGVILQCPPALLLQLVASFTTLSGCMTHFSSGPMLIYFGLGYVSQKRWYLVGMCVAALHITTFLTFGLAWWKILGWF